MNLFEDANYLYDAGTKAMNGSKWKYSTQLFEINHLLETAVLQKKLTEKDYHPGRGQKFKICERGKPRYITSSDMVDKTVFSSLHSSMRSGRYILASFTKYPTISIIGSISHSPPYALYPLSAYAASTDTFVRTSPRLTQNQYSLTNRLTFLLILFMSYAPFTCRSNVCRT